MSRVLKKRRKRYPGLPEDRALKQDHFSQSTADKCEKFLGKLSIHHIPCDLVNQERLAGGADNAEQIEAISSAGIEPEKQSEEAGENVPASSNSPESSSNSLSEKNVNEMIDDVIEHLQEAGKALAVLTGDHEHDLKQMLVDVMVKLQSKVDVIQSKVDSGINELNELRKQLASRTSELEELKIKLAEAKTKKVTHEKALGDNELRLSTTDPLSSPVQSAHAPGPSAHAPGPSAHTSDPSAHTLGPSAHTLGPSAHTSDPSAHTLRPSAHTPGLSAPMSPSATPRLQQKSQLSAGALASQLSPRITSEVRLDGSIKIPSGIAALPGDAPVEIHGSLQRDVSGKIQGSFHGNIQGSSPSSIRGSFIGNNLEIIQEDGHQRAQGQGLSVLLRVDGAPGPSGLPSRPGDPTAPSTIPIEQLADYNGDNRQYVQSERGQREVELENECERLRRENDRIMKERADYENAIQRAILKGVSSLNVETLKVLKNPPISCCTPCPPCNEETDSTTAANILCPKTVKDSWCPREKSTLPSKLDVLRQKEKSSRCTKKQAPSVCYSSGIGNKASQESMVFVLPQQTDTCSQYPRFCARPNSAEPKSVCHDSKYRKSSSKERNYFAGRAQKSGNQDVCPVSIRDYSRTLNCTDIFTTAARYDSHDTKRCDPCSRIRRIFED